DAGGLSLNRPYILIEDVEDPRIAAYRDIRERDLVGRQGKFVAEGKTVLNVLFSNARLEAESVFLRENRVAGAADLLAQVPDHVPVYVASGAVMDQIAGFHMHRGVLAIGRRIEEQQSPNCSTSCPRKRWWWRSPASPIMTIWVQSSATRLHSVRMPW